MSKVQLLQFPGAFGLPNLSIFCFKLEAWMSLMDIPFEVVATPDPRSAPKGKLPCIVDGERTVADSSHILDYLKVRFERDPDAHLTPRQRGDAIAYQRLCEDHLYWALVYSRWVDEDGWRHMGKRVAGFLPAPVRWGVHAMLRRGIRRDLHGQGLGRHSKKELYRFAIEDLNALAGRLDGETFFFGDDPASIDTIVLATVANVLWTPIENEMVEHARELPVLHDYCVRVWERCFPGRDLPELAGA